MSVLTSVSPRALPAWAAGAGTASLLGLLWVVAVCVEVEAPGWLRAGALFTHLAALVVGLGAVVVIDWTALRWVMGHSSYVQVCQTAAAVHLLIWGALVVLMVSGAVLNPDTSSALIRAKLALVLVLAVNGLHAKALGLRLGAIAEDRPPRPLLIRATVIAAVSQLSWWTVMLLGHLNTQG